MVKHTGPLLEVFGTGESNVLKPSRPKGELVKYLLLLEVIGKTMLLNCIRFVDRVVSGHVQRLAGFEFGCVHVGTRPRERAKKLLLFDEMRDCVRYRALDAIVTGDERLLLTKFCEQTCHMTKTQVLLKTSQTPKTPSPDFQLPLGPMVPKRKRLPPRKNKLPVIPVPPAELLLDDNARLAVAVGDLAIPIAALGAEEWPLPNELLLLLEPEQQPEVLAEVDLDDPLKEHLSSVDAVADP